MTIAYELKTPIQEVMKYTQDEIGWWLAYFKLKQELEDKRSKQRSRKAGQRTEAS